MTSTHLSVVIDAAPQTVYAYAADPSNLPHWAAGLADSPVHEVDGHWITDSPMGRVEVSFAPANDLGVLDHVVTLPSGEQVYNPLRVIPYAEASEVVFTLRRRDGMSDDEFSRDAAAVRADLETLKQLLESR